MPLDDIHVSITHSLYLGVLTHRIDDDLKQGRVVVVRQNGSEMTVYSGESVRIVPFKHQKLVMPSPRKSLGLSLQLSLLALYLWQINKEMGDVRTLSRQAHDLIKHIVFMNSDAQHRGFPEATGKEDSPWFPRDDLS